MIQSVGKAMDILDFVAKNHNASVKDLSINLGITRSTVCRLAQTLLTRGYLFQDELTGNYLLSYKFFRVGYDILERSGIRQCAVPIMRQLAKETKATVNLSVLDGTKAMFVEKIDSQVLINGVAVGARVPLHCTASGKAIFASLPEDHVNEILNKCIPLEAYTENTIVSVEELLNDIGKCRQMGFSISNDEFSIGLHSIGSWVTGYPGREVAALSLAWPSNRSAPERFNEWGEMLKAAAGEVSSCFSSVS